MNGEMIVENLIDDYFGQLSEMAIDLVKALIKKDPHERLSAKQALESKWMITKLRTSEPLENTKQSLRQRML